MNKVFIFFLLIFSVFCFKANAQAKNDKPNLDKKRNKEISKQALNNVPARGKDVSDTLSVSADSLLQKPVDYQPNPSKALWMAAVCPGLGQIYNKKYWKLPLLYGGVVGLVYAISWNGARYNEYTQAYRDLVLGTGTSYENFLRPGATYDKNQLIDTFKRRKDFFRRNRDLSIIVSVAVYALSLIDAYVDANLYNFNVSPNLSIKVEPVLWGPTSYSKTAVGLQYCITF